MKRFAKLIIDRANDETLLCLSQEAFDAFPDVEKVESDEYAIEAHGLIFHTWYELKN